MPFTVTLTTDIGKVRLLIPDRVESEAVFSDDEITALLTIEGESVKRAAALGLETIASDEVMVMKVMSLQNLSTNGAAVATALLNRAKMLREQADADDPAELDGAVDIASPAFSPFGTREIIYNRRIRNG